MQRPNASVFACRCGIMALDYVAGINLNLHYGHLTMLNLKFNIALITISLLFYILKVTHNTSSLHLPTHFKTKLIIWACSIWFTDGKVEV